MGDGRTERDETRQGRTLPQQGVRRRVNRESIPISSHDYFIPYLSSSFLSLLFLFQASFNFHIWGKLSIAQKKLDP